MTTNLIPEIEITHNGHVIEVFKDEIKGLFTARWVKGASMYSLQGNDLSTLIREAQASLDCVTADFYRDTLGVPWSEPV